MDTPTASPGTLPADWIQWVAEQRLRRCAPETMIATMVNAGFTPAIAQQAVNGITQEPCYHAAERFIQLTSKLESVMANLQRLWELQPDYSTVEKRSQIPRDEFIERYCIGNRPVVITDMADDWPARQRWSPAYLKERFGDISIEIQAGRDNDPDYEPNKLQHRTQMRIGDFVDKVLAVGASNDFYLTANNEALRRPELAPLLDDIGSMPPILDRTRLASESSLWFGPAGTVTPLHHDTLMLFHTQIIGRKRWRFISPLETPRLYNYNGVFSPIDLDNVDWQRYPDFAGVKVLEVIVEPGETVFLPLAWWHQVTSLDVCLSFSFSNLALPNSYEYKNPDITNW